MTRNGFHVNGDQTKSGLSGFTYRPFTLEGNFLFMDAVQEMYLQSWGETLRIFPSVPADWKDCSFRDLRAEGGLKVSATRKDGMTRSVTISSKHGGQVNLRNPFGKDPYQSSRPIKTKDGPARGDTQSRRKHHPHQQTLTTPRNQKAAQRNPGGFFSRQNS